MRKGDFAYWSETAALFERDEVAGAVFAYLTGLDLSNFVVSAFPTSDLREVMLDAERPVEELFLREIADELTGDEWRGTNQEYW